MEKYGMSFKEMNMPQKISYIWTYYRYHILAVIIGSIMIFSLGKTFFFPAPPDKVDVMICGPVALNEDEIKVTDAFKDDYETGLTLLTLNWQDDAKLANAMRQKIPSMINMDELEIVALPVDEYEGFIKAYGTKMFTPLEDVPEFKELLEKNKDRLFKYDIAYDDNGNEVKAEEHVYGIKVSDFPTISCIDKSNDMVVGLTTSIKDRNKALCMYRYIVGETDALEHFHDGDHDADTEK